MSNVSRNRCPGSGEEAMLSWFPDDSGYPGAGICPICSGGIQVKKTSVREATSLSGFDGLAGILKAHDR